MHDYRIQLVFPWHRWLLLTAELNSVDGMLLKFSTTKSTHFGIMASCCPFTRCVFDITSDVATTFDSAVQWPSRCQFPGIACGCWVKLQLWQVHVLLRRLWPLQDACPIHYESSRLHSGGCLLGRKNIITIQGQAEPCWCQAAWWRRRELAGLAWRGQHGVFLSINLDVSWLPTCSDIQVDIDLDI